MTECGACGSPLPPDGRHCTACGAGTSRVGELSGWRSATPEFPDAGPAGPAGVAAPAAPAGTAVGETADDLDPVEGPAPRRHPRWPGFVLIVVGLALIGIGAYTTYRGEHDPRPGLPPGIAPTHPAKPSAPAGVNATPSASTTSSASQGSAVVTVAPALNGQPDVADVVATLTTYFTAINRRDYASFRSVMVGADQRVRDEEDFHTRFRSTSDSQVWLVGMRRDAEGEVFATVTFRSRQDPADSPDLVSDCLSWVVTYPMTRVDGAVRIDVVRTFAQTHRPC